VPIRFAAASPTIAGPDLPEETRTALLAVARRALETHFGSEAAPRSPEVNGLSERRGAFVTLRSGGELRGCIGHIADDLPLRDVVARMAVAAATEDPRFSPLGLAELPGVRIEISVLTPPQPLRHRDVTQIVPGRDGLVVQRGDRQGLLLPQVATEYEWDAEAFLAATCRKAGFATDAWRDPQTDILVFRAEVFGE